MNVIQRRSSSMFSLSLPHVLSLSLLSFSRTLTLSVSLSLSLSRSLSPSHTHTHTRAPYFLLFRTHSVSMSLFCLYFARIHDSRPRMRAVAVRVHACARKREHSREHEFEWTILRALMCFFFWFLRQLAR